MDGNHHDDRDQPPLKLRRSAEALAKAEAREAREGILIALAGGRVHEMARSLLCDCGLEIEPDIREDGQRVGQRRTAGLSPAMTMEEWS